MQQTTGSQPRDCKGPVQTCTAARNSGLTERATGTPEPGAANPNPTIAHTDDCEGWCVAAWLLVERMEFVPIHTAASRSPISTSWLCRG